MFSKPKFIFDLSRTSLWNGQSAAVMFPSVFYNIVCYMVTEYDLQSRFLKSQIGFLKKKSTGDLRGLRLSRTPIIHKDVHSFERRSFLWDCVWFLRWHVYVFVRLFFYMTVHRLYCMCRPCVFLFIWYEKNYLIACMKWILHVCNIHQCIIEDSVCVYSCNPPGLPPPWQLRVWEKAFAGGVIFWSAALCVG